MYTLHGKGCLMATRLPTPSRGATLAVIIRDAPCLVPHRKCLGYPISPAIDLECPLQSVINQELRDRQKLLQEILIPASEAGIPVSSAMTGRVVALLPGVPLMNGVPGSKLSTRLEDIQEKFEESVRVGVWPHSYRSPSPWASPPFVCWLSGNANLQAVHQAGGSSGGM